MHLYQTLFVLLFLLSTALQSEILTPVNIEIRLKNETLSLWKKLKETSSNPGINTNIRNKYRKMETMSRMAGGQPAMPLQFPWQAFISMDNDFFCAGSLISPRWILTAAHCVNIYRTFTVRVGSIVPHSGGHVQSTLKRYCHADYSGYPTMNDIGLLEMNYDFQITKNVRPIHLPKHHHEHELDGVAARFSGWGGDSNNAYHESNILQWTDVLIINKTFCQSVFGFITDNHLCVSGGTSRRICQSDSGGPLAIQDSQGRWFQVGIASLRFEDACQLDLPTIFTKVSSYLKWIADNTRENYIL